MLKILAIVLLWTVLSAFLQVWAKRHRRKIVTEPLSNLAPPSVPRFMAAWNVVKNKPKQSAAIVFAIWIAVTIFLGIGMESAWYFIVINSFVALFWTACLAFVFSIILCFWAADLVPMIFNPFLYLADLYVCKFVKPEKQMILLTSISKLDFTIGTFLLFGSQNYPLREWDYYALEDGQ